MSKFKNWFLGFFGGVSKENQTIIQVSNNRELEDQQRKPNDFIRATVARVYLAFKKLTVSRHYDLECPDIKLSTIQNAIKVESYLRRARDRFVELIWKNGYEVIGKNKTAVNYVKRRLKEISQITTTPTSDLFEAISEQLILFYNCFIIKVRKANSSTGKVRKYFNKTVQPVAGYFIGDVTKMRARVDKDTKQILGWEYLKDAYEWKEREYDFRDIIHITMSKPAGKIFGEPVAIPVLNDIRALRRMEENVEILVFQHSIPLYHYMVGTEEKPAVSGEVESVRDEVELMLTQGMLVTPERHKITAIGAQREALKVDIYLEYFKTRILTGLGHSAISLGEGGGVSRATASILSKSVIDAAIRFQTKIKTYINDFIIDELLAEGGFNIFDERNKVELFIPEIDLDDKLRKEFHIMSLWEANLLTEDEARKELGRDPYTKSDRDKTYFELITKPRTLMQAVDEPYLSTATSHKAVANKTIPQNQHGQKRSGATQRTGGDSGMVEVKDSINIEELSDIANNYLSIFKSQYYAVQEDIYTMIEEKSFNSGKLSINLSKGIVIEKGSFAIIEAYKTGLKKAGNHPLTPVEADLKMLHNYHVKSIFKLFDDLLEMIDNSNKSKDDIMGIFDSQFYRIGFMVDWYIRKAYWLSIASSLKAQGIEKVAVVKNNPDKSDVCYNYPDTIDLKSVLYLDKIPPYYSFCNCFLNIEKDETK